MAFIHVFVLGLVSMASCAKDIVRREKYTDISLHLGANGELISTKPAEQDDSSLNVCNDDFPLGKARRSVCQEPKFDYLIINREMCIEAARQAGVSVDHQKFVVQDLGQWRWRHPKGCFKTRCEEAHTSGHMQGLTDSEKAAQQGEAGGWCYYFNPLGTNPTEEINGVKQLTGVPVCYRPKIVRGNITSAGASECHQGFNVIQTENSCREAATCLGLCEGQLFNINQEVNSKFNNYPEGCFIEENTKCVYLNPKPNNWNDDPTNPVGTPLCNVSSVTGPADWPTDTAAQNAVEEAASSDATAAAAAAAAAR